MTRKSDGDLAAEIKAQVALAALRGDRTLAQLSAQFNLDPSQIEEWKKELERNASAAFSQSDPTSSEAPTIPVSRAPAKVPTLPAGRGTGTQPAQQSSPRLRAPTLPTLPTVREVAVSPSVDTSRSPTAPATADSRDPPTVPQWPSEPKPATVPKRASEILDDDLWDEEALPTRGVRPAKSVSVGPVQRPPSGGRPPAWSHKLLGPLFVGWKERHYAARTSRELLKLYERMDAAHRGLNKQELYLLIVIAWQEVTVAEAEEVLAHATESFAAWPVERALTFRDLVHYLAVSQYLASNDVNEAWTRESFGRVVASMVPDNL